ncbi:MAG: hypothetical protein NT001_00160 [Candidatus Woesearchaeota archaeon]|nr:hypothetical protein [Candidatus Woesearchaeota archaeon]
MNKANKSTIKKNKNAVVEVQFNWIFILIAGALILAFFIIIISKQKAVSDKKLSVDILNSIDQIMSGQKTSENRQDVIDMFKTSMSYSCGGCDCAISLGGMSKSKGNVVLFAPSEMRSDRLLTWTQSWDMPFRVTNFIYMTVPEIKYYFIVPSTSSALPESIKTEFISNLPVNLSYEIVDSADSIQYKGEQRIRLVFFSVLDFNGVVPANLQKVSDPAITALVIDPVDSSKWPDGKAELNFYKKSKTDFVLDNDEEGISNSYPALGIQSAYGAVYSDSFQNFKCNMDDAVKRLNLVSGVYEERSNILSEKAVSGEIFQGCSIYYSTGYFNGFDINEDDVSDTGKVFGLYSSISMLSTWNDGAIINSCPRIY